MSISTPTSQLPAYNSQAESHGAQWDPQRRRRAGRRRRRFAAIVAATAVALAALGSWNLARGDDGPGREAGSDRPELRAGEEGPRATGQGGSTETDAAQSMFDSGLPDTVSTLPALTPGSIDAFADASHEFVVAVHAAANAKITGIDLPAELRVDQVRLLQERLAVLSAQAAGNPDATQLAAANHLYTPVIALLDAESGADELAEQLRSANDQWSAALTAASPNTHLALPSIAKPQQVVAEP